MDGAAFVSRSACGFAVATLKTGELARGPTAQPCMVMPRQPITTSPSRIVLPSPHQRATCGDQTASSRRIIGQRRVVAMRLDSVVSWASQLREQF